MATGDPHTNFRDDQSSGSRDMLTDRQTDMHTQRQTNRQTDKLIAVLHSPTRAE